MERMADGSDSLHPGFSVVVPVYNSEGSLEPLCERVSAVFGAMAVPFEIVLVNDGSEDASWEVIRRLSAEHSFVRGLNLMRNYGQHNALLCGIRDARREFVVTLDDDLQNPPEEIPRLVDVLTSATDVVYGTPEVEQHGFWRNRASQVSKMVLQHAMGARIARRISAYRLFRTDLRDAFADYRGSFVSIDVLLTWATRRFAAVPVRHDPRVLGESNYGFRQLVTHTLNMATGFGLFPLQVASVAGLVAGFFGVCVLLYAVGRTLIQGVAVPGFAFLASVIAIFSGVQLFSIGIIGEYLGRIHTRTMDRPAYVVRRRVESGPSAGGQPPGAGSASAKSESANP